MRSARRFWGFAMSLKAMIAAAEGQDRRSIRDRAILALGLAAALRHSKTDQEGEGQVIAVPAGKVLKPVDRLKAWMAVRGNGAGPLFYQIGPQGRLTDQSMSDCSVARLIQKYAGGWGSTRRRWGAIRCGPSSSPRRRGMGRPLPRCRRYHATRRSRCCSVMSGRRNCLTITRAPVFCVGCE
jgi:hypothetical protein